MLSRSFRRTGSRRACSRNQLRVSACSSSESQANQKVSSPPWERMTAWGVVRLAGGLFMGRLLKESGGWVFRGDLPASGRVHLAVSSSVFAPLGQALQAAAELMLGGPGADG